MSEKSMQEELVKLSRFEYSEDATVLGGSTGKVHGSKIHYILKMARETMVPAISKDEDIISFRSLSI